MSAYIVQDETINKVVSWLIERANEGHEAAAGVQDLGYYLPGSEYAEKLATDMFALNVESVNARYGEGAAADFRPLDFAWVLTLPESTAEALDSLEDWLYQSCEGECYANPRYQALDAVKEAMKAYKAQHPDKADIVKQQVQSERWEYIGVADTAKLMRQALKQEFPGIKFSVRSDSYSGGASIRIAWQDGPTTKEVEGVVNVYAGGGFDGMIDMAYSHYTWLLPDGTASPAYSHGTVGSGGLDESHCHAKPHPQARPVRFGADHIFCNRDYSLEFARKVAEEYHKEVGWPIPEIKVCNNHAYFERDYKQIVPGGYETIADEYNRKLWETSAYVKTENKAEAPKVENKGKIEILAFFGLAIPPDPHVFDIDNRIFRRTRDPGAEFVLRESYIAFPTLQPFVDPRLDANEQADSVYTSPVYLLLTTQGPPSRFQMRLQYNAAGGSDRGASTSTRCRSGGARNS